MCWQVLVSAYTCLCVLASPAVSAACVRPLVRTWTVAATRLPSHPRHAKTRQDTQAIRANTCCGSLSDFGLELVIKPVYPPCLQPLQPLASQPQAIQPQSPLSPATRVSHTCQPKYRIGNASKTLLFEPHLVRATPSATHAAFAGACSPSHSISSKQTAESLPGSLASVQYQVGLRKYRSTKV